MTRKPIPFPESATQITSDYWNEFYGVYLQFKVGGNEAVARLLRESPIQEYEQRYPVSEYIGVLTRGNRTSVKRLNRLVRYANSRFIDSEFDQQDFARLIHSTYQLIYGKKLEVPLL